MSRRRIWLFVAAGAVSLVVGAPHAAADPSDHVPWCSGDETPMNNNCRVAPSQVLTDSAPGANPEVPLGTGSGEALMPAGQG
jgi:hypothetical protein